MFDFDKIKAGISPGLYWIIIVFLAVAFAPLGIPLLFRKLNDLKKDHSKASLALMLTGLFFSLLGGLLLLGNILEPVDPAGSRLAYYGDTLYILTYGLYLTAIGLIFFLKHSQVRRLRFLIMDKEIDDLSRLAELLRISEFHLTSGLLELIQGQALTGISLSLQDKKVIRTSYKAVSASRRHKDIPVLSAMIYFAAAIMTLINPIKYFPFIVLLCLGLTVLKYCRKPDIHDRIFFFGIFLLGLSIQLNCLIRSDIYFSSALTSPEIHPVNATFASFLIFLLLTAASYLLKRRAGKDLIRKQLGKENV